MKNLILIFQIIVSSLLIIFILLQPRGSGVFARESNFFRKLRGFEKHLYWTTIIFASIFIILGILNLYLQ